MPIPLTPAQKEALIAFAERNLDLLDTLLSCDCELIASQTDADTCDDEDTQDWASNNWEACARLRRTLKQVETV